MHDVPQARSAHQAGNRHHLLHRLRRFHERHVGPAGECGVGAGDRFVEPCYRACAGACDHQAIRAPSGASRGAQLGQPVVQRDDLLAVQMPASLAGDLVPDMDPRHVAPHAFPHRAKRVQFVSIAGMSVLDHRNADGPREAPDVLRPLGQGQQPEISPSFRHRRHDHPWRPGQDAPPYRPGDSLARPVTPPILSPGAASKSLARIRPENRNLQLPPSQGPELKILC